MNLTIHPDPQEPAGGYAFLELPGGTLGPGQVSVAVMEVYGSRWLGPSDAASGKVGVGAASWQGERHDFGPYAVHAHDGADWVRIGPEIVNKIEEYTPIQIVVGGRSVDAVWPDDVPPRAGAAILGGLLPATRAAAPDEAAALVGKPPEQAEQDPEPDPEPDPVPPPADPVPDPGDRSARRLWWLLLPGAVLIAGVSAFWWVSGREPPVEQGAVTPSETCTKDAVTALEGFGATQQAIGACGDALSADTVLEIVEDAAARGDAQALLLFGTLYDGTVQEERIETVIGLSFEHDAARAAEYYARAVTAGSEMAATRLAATCAQLAGSNETLAKGAFDDYCK